MTQPLAGHVGVIRMVTCSHLADKQLFVLPCMGTSQRPCLNCGDDILPHQEEHVVHCVHCSSPSHHNCVRPHMLKEHSSRIPDSLKEHPSRPVDRPPPAHRPPQPLACCAMLPTGRMKLLGAKPSREDPRRAEERIALQLAAAESQPSGEGTPCAEETKADSAAIVASKRQHTLPTPPHAESLRSDRLKRAKVASRTQ